SLQRRSRVRARRRAPGSLRGEPCAPAGRPRPPQDRRFRAPDDRGQAVSTTTNHLKLTFANGTESLDVRHFSVHEAINELFEVSILAISDDSNVDISGIVGKGAIFKLETHNHQSGHPVR